MAELKEGNWYRVLKLHPKDAHYDNKTLLNIIYKYDIRFYPSTGESPKSFLIVEDYPIVEEVPAPKEFDAFPKPSKTDEEDGWKTHSFSELKDHAQHPAAYPLRDTDELESPYKIWVPPGSGKINDDALEKVFNKREFESGAVRDTNEGKSFVHSLQGYTRLRFGYHMSKNAAKYGENNFLLGIPSKVYLESIDRHLAQYISGDRTEDHLSSLIFGLQGLMLNEEKEGIDAKHYYGK